MRILLADDHPIFRKGLKAVIENEYEYCVVVEVNNGDDAIKELKYDSFAICILDIDMPGSSGIEVLYYIKENSVNVKPIMLTMHKDELFFNEAFDNGAIGYLLKEDSSIELFDCISNILAGSSFVSEKLIPFVQNRKSFTSKLSEFYRLVDSLTNAEFNTLRLVAKNKTSKEISELLFVTVKSVENYRTRICKKLDITGGSNTLYKWCVENKVLIDRKEARMS